jgi:hypothetical protein
MKKTTSQNSWSLCQDSELIPAEYEVGVLTSIQGVSKSFQTESITK